MCFVLLLFDGLQFHNTKKETKNFNEDMGLYLKLHFHDSIKEDVLQTEKHLKSIPILLLIKTSIIEKPVNRFEIKQHTGFYMIRVFIESHILVFI